MCRTATIVLGILGAALGCCWGAQHGPPPCWIIGHRVADIDDDDAPDRTEIACCEEVQLWIDDGCEADHKKGAARGSPRPVFLDRLGDVRWVTTGPAAVNPEAGPETRLAVNEEEVDSTITVEATAPDAGMSNPGSHEGVTTASVTFTSKVPAGIQIFKADGDASGWTPGTPLVRFVAWSETAGDLPAELKTLDSLRRGRNTPFAEAEERAAELLTKYPKPADHGQIYFALVQVYGQSAGPPERIIHNAKKALGLSLSPEQRSRLYVYWGDAALVLDPTKPLPERRRNAAAIFLAGLAWLRYLQLPDKAPERPQFDSSDVSDQLNEEEAQQQNIRYQAEMAAISAVRFQRAMVRQRDVLIGQLTWLYSRKPFATDELRELTLKTTKDAQLTDLLVKAVEVRIKASK